MNGQMDKQIYKWAAKRMDELMAIWMERWVGGLIKELMGR